MHLNARRPAVRAALAALATLPDEQLMGWMKAPDGSMGEEFTVADLRRLILGGTCTADIDHIPDSVRLMHTLRHAPLPSDEELVKRLQRYPAAAL